MVPTDSDATRWEEKGQGTLSIMQGQSGKTRMIMKTEPKGAAMGRSSAGSTTLLNQLVAPRASLVPAQSEDGSDKRAFVFDSEDYATSAWPASPPPPPSPPLTHTPPPQAPPTPRAPR